MTLQMTRSLLGSVVEWPQRLSQTASVPKKELPAVSAGRSTTHPRFLLPETFIEEQTMDRRNFTKAGEAVTLYGGLGVGDAQDVPSHTWDQHDFGSGPKVTDRLNQGPFGIEQDEGWYTILATSQSDKR